MSDYGVFEASSTDGYDEEQRQRQATRDLGRAIEAAREGFGDFLGMATDKQDYKDRLALVMNDLMQKVADSGVMPVPGVMRKVKAALRPEFRTADTRSEALEWAEGYYERNKTGDGVDTWKDALGLAGDEFGTNFTPEDYARHSSRKQFRTSSPRGSVDNYNDALAWAESYYEKNKTGDGVDTWRDALGLAGDEFGTNFTPEDYARHSSRKQAGWEVGDQAWAPRLHMQVTVTHKSPDGYWVEGVGGETHKVGLDSLEPLPKRASRKQADLSGMSDYELIEMHGELENELQNGSVDESRIIRDMNGIQDEAEKRGLDLFDPNFDPNEREFMSKRRKQAGLEWDTEEKNYWSYTSPDSGLDYWIKKDPSDYNDYYGGSFTWSVFDYLAGEGDRGNAQSFDAAEQAIEDFIDSQSPNSSLDYLGSRRTSSVADLRSYVEGKGITTADKGNGFTFPTADGAKGYISENRNGDIVVQTLIGGTSGGVQSNYSASETDLVQDWIDRTAELKQAGPGDGNNMKTEEELSHLFDEGTPEDNFGDGSVEDNFSGEPKDNFKKSRRKHADDYVKGDALNFINHLQNGGYRMPKDAGYPGEGGQMDDELYDYTGGDQNRISELTRFLQENWDYYAYGASRKQAYSDFPWEEQGFDKWGGEKYGFLYHVKEDPGGVTFSAVNYLWGAGKQGEAATLEEAKQKVERFIEQKVRQVGPAYGVSLASRTAGAGDWEQTHDGADEWVCKRNPRLRILEEDRGYYLFDNINLIEVTNTFEQAMELAESHYEGSRKVALDWSAVQEKVEQSSWDPMYADYIAWALDNGKNVEDTYSFVDYSDLLGLDAEDERDLKKFIQNTAPRLYGSRKVALDIDGSWEEELPGIGYASCSPKAGGGFELYMWSDTKQSEALDVVSSSEEARRVWQEWRSSDVGPATNIYDTTDF